MSVLRPTETRVFATAVVDSLVVAADPNARSSGLFYWKLAQPWTGAVVAAVEATSDPMIRSLGRRLLDDPADPARYTDLRSALVERAGPATTELFELAWQAECKSRVGHHLGQHYQRGTEPVDADELATMPAGTGLSGDSGPEVLVVVPFQDRGPERRRLRNLLACLLALRDQSAPRDSYQVVVVETDDLPRWRETVSRYADHYVFAPKPGAFNKSWAVNAGVVNAPGEAEVICILDADVLTDRRFIARNAARFRRPGTGGHITYRNMLCLDPHASAWAIRERVHRRAAEASGDHLRGFALRRPPGACLWVRSPAFHRIGGMDERYEGWGGEDNDFAYRFDVAAPFDSYDDWLLHLSHPPSSVLTDGGGLVNDHIPALSWRPSGPVGRLDRFVAGQDT